MDPADKIRIVFVTCPNDQAARLLKTLIEERLVAGGNIVSNVRSFYRWKGNICDEPEAMLWMETSLARVPTMMSRLSELHPYEVPKILTFTPQEGLPAYLNWVDEETSET